MKILSLPMPAFAAALLQQMAPGLMAEGPGWLIGVILGAWVVLWFLDRVGRLPGRAAGERRSASFTAEDRLMLAKLHNLLAHRDDEEGIERFLRFMQRTRASQETLDRLAQLHADGNQKLDMILKELRNR